MSQDEKRSGDEQKIQRPDRGPADEAARFEQRIDEILRSTPSRKPPQR
jgi:hypothetical protein